MKSAHFSPVFIFFIPVVVLLYACDGAQQKNNKDKNDSAGAGVSHPSFPTERKMISKEPVAVYTEKVKNPLNDWRFQVKITETAQTFRYLLHMEYEEMDEQDTLKIPNLGFEPKLEIRKGDKPYSCIIGFIDNKNEFREYKEVIATNNRLRVVTLKHYGVYYK